MEIPKVKVKVKALETETLTAMELGAAFSCSKHPQRTNHPHRHSKELHSAMTD
jgi:hypothetical protein